MGPKKSDPEVFDNAVASLVDVSSLLFAYEIGLSGFGIWVGILYACFDAFIVIWMRKHVSRFARSINPFRARSGDQAATGTRTGSPAMVSSAEQT